ncbi:MAG: HD domain-containing phosphohydrolase [Leptospirales bacterium]
MKLQSNLEGLVEQRSIEVIELYKKLLLAHDAVIYTLARAAEYRDNETGTHIKRIGEFSKIIAHKMGFTEHDAVIIGKASLMHDVGKIGIEDRILLKPGQLIPEEFEIMKTHTTIGEGLLHGVGSELTNVAAEIAISHHEKMDGTGYPYGLKGDNIPLGGRIVSVVDVFDALTSNRPYKEAWSNEKATDLIRKQKGKQFDPKVVDAFFSSLNDILAIKEKMPD